MIDAYVIGTGLPELAAALELAEVGLSVRVAAPVAGDAGDAGAIPPLEAAGDAEPERDAEGALRALLAHVAAPLQDGGPGAAEAEPRDAAPAPVLLRGAGGAWSPQPEPAVLGIPAVALSAQSLALLGGSGAARAYLDRVKPLLTIGKTAELGRLVRSRLGRVALETLVEPVVRERFGASADAVDVALAAPGLNEAMSRAGSLSGGVLASAERDVARETAVVPAGGWDAARRALRDRLALYGARFAEAGIVDVRATGDAEAPFAVVDAAGETVRTRAVVAGIDADAAAERAVRALPGIAAALAESPRPRRRTLVEAVIAEPELPEPGRDALRTVEVAGEPWSLRLRPATADAPARARATGPAVDAAGVADADAAVAALDAALAEVGAVRSGDARVRTVAAPFATVAERDAARDALAARREADPGLLLVGAGLHGGSASAAVADAREAAVHLRRRLTGIAE